MKKYKVCVYAISKNESKFVDRWYESIKEADKIYVLDTGSTDNTVELLEKNGVIVKQEIIDPWRFDIARNKSLDMVDSDADICVCVDLDEVFNKGWREELEKKWDKDITRASYTYNWNHDENDNPIISFYIEKIHSRNDYKWVNPVHEVLECINNNEKFIKIENIIVDHYPDNTKSRSSYLPLLELAVEENPENDRNVHYLGREYMYHRRWNESIDTLIRHLSLKSSTWKDERCASMRFISRCYINLNRPLEAEMWLKKAIEEAPYLRDPYVEMAMLKYNQNEYIDVEYYCKEALKIEKNNKTYINEPFSFDETIYDLLSISLYYLGKIDESIKYVNKALEINPNNDRLLNNKIILEEKNTL